MNVIQKWSIGISTAKAYSDVSLHNNKLDKNQPSKEPLKTDNKFSVGHSVPMLILFYWLMVDGSKDFSVAELEILCMIYILTGVPCTSHFISTKFIFAISTSHTCVRVLDYRFLLLTATTN